jgi:pimeloyl-ACP methyl ester carboxylesterase
MVLGLDLEQRHLTVRDGTRIGYQVCGQGPTVVLANGLGGTYVAFRHVIDALAGYRVLTWDYRGLYTSSAPSDPEANTIRHHVDDLVELLGHERIDRAVFVGWSMGVQVNFELCRAHHDRVAGLYVVNGTAGKAFHTVMSSRVAQRLIPVLLRMIKAQSDLVGRAAKVVAGSDALIATMKRFGLVSDRIDMDVFRHVASGFKTIDWRIYSDLLTRLDEHDAADVLPAIRVPTTIVTGDHDLMTPPATAERIHRAIAGSRMVVVEGWSHYTPAEYPAIIKDELGRLLDRVPGWERRTGDQA